MADKLIIRIDNGQLVMVVPVEDICVGCDGITVELAPDVLQELDACCRPSDSPQQALPFSTPVSGEVEGREASIVSVINAVKGFNSMLAEKAYIGIVPDLEVVALPGAPPQLILKRVSLRETP